MDEEGEKAVFRRRRPVVRREEGAKGWKRDVVVRMLGGVVCGLWVCEFCLGDGDGEVVVVVACGRYDVGGIKREVSELSLGRCEG
jgi:hypothetical protein